MRSQVLYQDAKALVNAQSNLYCQWMTGSESRECMLAICRSRCESGFVTLLCMRGKSVAYTTHSHISLREECYVTLVLSDFGVV